MSEGYYNQQEELLKKILVELRLCVFPCKSDDKKPAVAGWQEMASNDPAKVNEWFDLTRFNYGVFCGTEHKGRYLTVVDVDNKKEKRGSESWAELTKGIDAELLNTFMVQTPTGGYHHYFYTRERFGNRTDVLEVSIYGDVVDMSLEPVPASTGLHIPS